MSGEVFVVDAIRTPIGRYGGALSSIRTDDLATIPIRELLRRNPSLDPATIEDIFMGCANQAGEDNRNIARMAGLLASLPETVPGVTINRLCGSGIDAVGTAARAIKTGELSLAIAGGVESMTRAPFVIAKAQQAFQRASEIYDTTIGWRFINPRMKTEYGVDSMTDTAEIVAAECKVSRADQDLFAFRSQQRAALAQQAGYFEQEIVPVEILHGVTAVMVRQDEHPRPDTTIEALTRLKPLRANGSITAGNSSGLNDGAAALLLASEQAVALYGFEPRARVLGMATAGVAPRTMGMGPVPATRKLLERLGLTIHDFDVIELNEAFASQSLACLRALQLPDDAPHVNTNGGAIALGHPLGMSGARLVLTAVHRLISTHASRALATMCIGVGQGIAIALERA